MPGIVYARQVLGQVSMDVNVHSGWPGHHVEVVTPEAMAMPMHKGSATRNTTNEASASCEKEFFFVTIGSIDASLALQDVPESFNSPVDTGIPVFSVVGWHSA